MTHVTWRAEVESHRGATQPHGTRPHAPQRSASHRRARPLCRPSQRAERASHTGTGNSGARSTSTSTTRHEQGTREHHTPHEQGGPQATVAVAVTVHRRSRAPSLAEPGGGWGGGLSGRATTGYMTAHGDQATTHRLPPPQHDSRCQRVCPIPPGPRRAAGGAGGAGAGSPTTQPRSTPSTSAHAKAKRAPASVTVTCEL